jgi:glutamate-ammonia-ligase adenylyltransferase
LRKIEHTLQLLHYKQVHSLPKDERELAYLARRLDFPDTEAFLTSYSQHCAEVRTIYVRYIEDAAPLTGDETSGVTLEPAVARQPRHSRAMEPSYFKVFSEKQISTHAKLLESLSHDTPICIDTTVAPGERVQLTVTPSRPTTYWMTRLQIPISNLPLLMPRSLLMSLYWNRRPTRSRTKSGTTS